MVVAGHLVAPDGPPAHPADAGAVHGQPALPRLHPGRPAPAPGGDAPSSSGRRPGSTAAAGQPPPAWSSRCSCSRARTTQMMDVPATRRWFAGLGRRAQHLPGLSGRRPHPGLRAGPGARTWTTCWAGCRPRSARCRRRTAMPTVTQLDLFAVDLPFKVAFRHAAAARTTSESLFLRARLDDGTEGWGECLPRAYVSGETPRAGLRPAAGHDPAGPGRPVVPVAPRGRVVPGEVRRQGPARVGRPEVPQTSAWCSVDLALLDAFGRASGEPARPAAGVPAPSAAALAPIPLQRGGVRRPGVVLCGVAAQDARLPVPPRQAQARAGRGPAGGPDRPAAARPPGRPPGRRQHGLGRRAGAGGHRPAASGRDPVVRAADRQRRPGRPGSAGGRVVGPDHGGRGPDRPRLVAAVHQPIGPARP